MTEKCDHDVECNRRLPEGFVSTEPTRVCLCCKSDFYVIESAMSEALDDEDDEKEIEHWRHEELIWKPAYLCDRCGGSYITLVSVT